MAVTYELIASNTLTSSATSVSFSSIPSTYMDLSLRGFARSDQSGSISEVVNLRFNGNTSSVYTYNFMFANNTTLSGGGSSDPYSRILQYITGASATSDSYGSFEIYIPSYTNSFNKQFSGYGTAETMSASTRVAITASLFSDTSVISSIQLFPLTGPNFVSGSSFYLYGIKNT